MTQELCCPKWYAHSCPPPPPASLSPSRSRDGGPVLEAGTCLASLPSCWPRISSDPSFLANASDICSLDIYGRSAKEWVSESPSFPALTQCPTLDHGELCMYSDLLPLPEGVAKSVCHCAAFPEGEAESLSSDRLIIRTAAQARPAQSRRGAEGTADSTARM